MENRSEIQKLQEVFGESLRQNVLLSRYSAARIGGPADYLLEVSDLDELIEAVRFLWKSRVPFLILGGGSNILVSDQGIRGIVIINKCRDVKFDMDREKPTVWAQSGANLGLIARQAAIHGLSGLEWAAGIPGTLGGAVVGNAGAHDGDIAGNLIQAEILAHRNTQSESSARIEIWKCEDFSYTYRGSKLKTRSPLSSTSLPESPQAVVLTAQLQLLRSTPELVKDKLDRFSAFRQKSQPPGASMGSMFKNPPGDYAGRLIDAAGLKGERIGDAQISTIHGNFFINQGSARAQDVYALIHRAKQQVFEQFTVDLELEIELLGDFSDAKAGYGEG